MRRNNLKRYQYGKFCYWFDPKQAPEGAVEVKAEKPSNKARQVKNKARKTARKAENDNTNSVGL